MIRALPLFLFLALLSLTTGCGDKMAQVTVKIKYKGQPVTAGSVLFAPKAPDDQMNAGRPATGAPDANGELQLSTHSKGDGALVGPHIVSYLPPGVPETSDAEVRAKRMDLFKKFGKCKLPPGHTVEIKPGRNEITLELTQ